MSVWDRYLGDNATDRREVLRDGDDIFRCLLMWDQERGSGGPFLASQTPIFAIWPRIEYLKNGKSQR